MWTLDPATLMNISQFYNCTNQLDHAQSTWGSQIVSSRNIWIDYQRPTSVAQDPIQRKNASIHSVSQYTVSIIFDSKVTALFLKNVIACILSGCDLLVIHVFHTNKRIKYIFVLKIPLN